MGLPRHFRAPTQPGEDISQTHRDRAGEHGQSLLFERNAPFWSDLKLELSISVGREKS